MRNYVKFWSVIYFSSRLEGVGEQPPVYFINRQLAEQFRQDLLDNLNFPSNKPQPAWLNLRGKAEVWKVFAQEFTHAEVLFETKPPYHGSGNG